MEQVEEISRPLWRRFIPGEAVLSLLVLAVLFVLPLLVVPGSLLAPEINKKLFLLTAVLVAFILWLFGRLADGLFVLPKTFIFAAALSVLLATLISSLVSPVPAVSLAGLGYELDTFLSLAAFFVLFFLSSIIFQNNDRLIKLIGLLTLTFLIVWIVWLLHLAFGLDWLGLVGQTATSLTGWNDFAIFAGLIAIMAMVLLETGLAGSRFRLVAALIFLVAFSALLSVNYNVIWWGLSGAGLLVFLTGIFKKREPAGLEKFFKLSLAVFLVSTALALWAVEGSAIDKMIDRFLPTPLEVRPSLNGTFGVARLALSENPIWGTGPNRFTSVWLRARPAEVIQGNFWNVDFAEGVGHLPTFLITGGLVSFLAWLVFLTLFLISGLRAITKLPENHQLYPFISAIFWSVCFLWFLFIFYLPGSAVMALTFGLSGAMLALLVQAGLIKNIRLLSSEKPAWGFASVLMVVILLILSASGLWLVQAKWRALVNFQRGFQAFAVSADLPAAEAAARKAASLDARDLYFRQLSEILVARLRQELAQPGLGQEALQSQFISTYGRVLEAAAAAKEADPTNYLNFLTAAGAYELAIPLGNSESYGLAQAEYRQALELNPTNPIIPHRLAQLELLVGNSQAAQEILAAALTLKPNFVQALLLSSQIEALAGNLEGAIGRAELALGSDQNSLDALFQLGVLYYRNDDWDKAIEVMERAVSLQSNYANAKYFLGLSYDKAGRQKEAVKIFEDLSLANPENVNVRQILSNLKAGRPALSGLPEPAETIPPNG